LILRNAIGRATGLRHADIEQAAGLLGRAAGGPVAPAVGRGLAAADLDAKPRVGLALVRRAREPVGALVAALGAHGADADGVRHLLAALASRRVRRHLASVDRLQVNAPVEVL